MVASKAFFTYTPICKEENKRCKMKSEIIENNGLKRVLKVNVPKETVADALEKEFKSIQRKVEIKGFRKGKAPLDQIKAMYGSKVSQTVLEDLVNENYFNALNEHSLSPIAMPKIDMVDGEKTDGGFSFTAEFEVKPEIKLKEVSSLKVSKEKVEVSSEDIEKHLEQIRASKAEVTPLLEDRAAKEGDWVKIDFAGTLTETNTPVENGTAKDFLLELGGKSLIEGFEDGVIGMKVGSEKTLSLNFPKDYFQSELAGKPVDFLVKLNSINKKDFPELNDAFAKEVSNFDSLDAFKEQIKKDLLTSKEKQVEQKLSDSLLVEYAKMHDIDLPESVINQQTESFKASTEQRLIQQGLNESDLASYHEKWNDDYRQNAEQSIKVSFVIDALAQQKNLYPSKEDIAKYYEELSTKTGIPTDKIRTYYNGPEKQRELEFKLMEEKVVEYLKENAQIN